ncbi:MAG: hypothetical protein Q9225_006086 [Loekoesia sp. 1 TL-2023]
MKKPLSKPLDAMKSVRWTGIVFLQSRSQGAVPSVVGEFLSEWRDQLPEPWRTHAILDALRGSYIQTSNDIIILDESGLTAGKDTSSAAHRKVTGPQARKWHEKFKSTRR